jgi:phosphohistidine swiveling domain-containing protein
VDPRKRRLTFLMDIDPGEEAQVGGKAAKLAGLSQAGYRVPDGFVIPTGAYQHFLVSSRLDEIIRMELGRKPLEGMRWEELWDTALRIRNAFSTATMPQELADEIGEALDRLGSDRPLVVRSSAPGEDDEGSSFAGLHESVVDVRGRDALLEAVRIVWSSLWSDAALLYRRELGLDPGTSNMAVLVQELVVRDRSGVAFARDPRRPDREVMVVEAVPGLCRDLVDGSVDPDRWLLDRGSGDVVEVRLGDRGTVGPEGPLLESADLGHLHVTLAGLEDRYGWPPDVEWTGSRDELVLLQTRPISTRGDAPSADDEDKRPWYLSLRPRDGHLRNLRQRVTEDLIPRLEAEGHRLTLTDIEHLDDASLADAIGERAESLAQWKKIYWRDFIPFAHGVRRLALYYNDAVKPRDPYEFVELVDDGTRLASRCNLELQNLAGIVRENPSLAEALAAIVRTARETGSEPAELGRSLADVAGAMDFVTRFDALLSTDLDVTYAGVRLSENPLSLLSTVTGLAERPAPESSRDQEDRSNRRDGLTRRLLSAVGESRREEAQEMLETARVSWRLRDDDNLLMGRIESQLMRALRDAAGRLEASGRLAPGAVLNPGHADLLAGALASPGTDPLDLPPPASGSDEPASVEPGLRARQLQGQPGSPGVATGRARCIRGPQDLAAFHPDEILVCDAMQPSMAHLVPLAVAVVERRGGMLIHGVIIARELGIPCVNGIGGLMDLVKDGDQLTVDGYLGIVTVGPSDLDLELNM